MQICEKPKHDIPLVSLLDMLRFYAAEFISVMNNLELVRHRLIQAEISPELGEIEWEQIENFLSDVLRVVTEIHLSRSLSEQVKRALEYAKKQDPNFIRILPVMVGEISHNVINELSEILYFSVSKDLKFGYLQPYKITGDKFESAFPDAVKDAHNGIKCIILDQWTASVFHFMRVLEHGIRYTCKLIETPIDNIDSIGWKNILDQIEKKIREMESLPRSDKKSEILTFLSEAATNFRYFKDAWRNHVSHSRAHYDENDARRVMDHVIDFMQHLAKRSSV